MHTLYSRASKNPEHAELADLKSVQKYSVCFKKKKKEKAETKSILISTSVFWDFSEKIGCHFLFCFCCFFLSPSHAAVLKEECAFLSGHDYAVIYT